MTYHDATAPDPTASEGSVELVIKPNAKDLGGFTVRRVLPSRDRQMVGPFIFFDHMGPTRFAVGKGIDVKPHPHIHLATVTYLFEGEIVHRDSLGSQQTIRPGAINWMTAGRAITHSERTASAERARRAKICRMSSVRSMTFTFHARSRLRCWTGESWVLTMTRPTPPWALRR